ncbi:hypothetical protein P5V15_002431 [Pogonomyrmex californicus]
MELLLKMQWKYLDLLWDSPQQKKETIASNGRIFITAVRDKDVPVSLFTVTEEQGKDAPLLRPYPDWSWYKDDCKGITDGVYQIEIRCNQLFVVDGGRIGEDQRCLPQLLIFDLSTDKLIKRVPINIAHNENAWGSLASVAVFIGSTEGYGLVVYNGHTSKLCRVVSDFMKPTDLFFTIANERYLLDDSIYDLYYAALTGNKIYKMEISKLIECPSNVKQTNRQTQLAGALGSPTAALASDRCAIFFSDITKYSIMCADTTKEINPSNKELIASDSKQLEFPSGLKIRHGELLILIK